MEIDPRMVTLSEVCGCLKHLEVVLFLVHVFLDQSSDMCPLNSTQDFVEILNHSEIHSILKFRAKLGLGEEALPL